MASSVRSISLLSAIGGGARTRIYAGKWEYRLTRHSASVTPEVSALKSRRPTRSGAAGKEDVMKARRHYFEGGRRFPARVG